MLQKTPPSPSQCLNAFLRWLVVNVNEGILWLAGYMYLLYAKSTSAYANENINGFREMKNKICIVCLTGWIQEPAKAG